MCQKLKKIFLAATGIVTDIIKNCGKNIEFNFILLDILFIFIKKILWLITMRLQIVRARTN